jgi:subtilisin family serine protease
MLIGVSRVLVSTGIALTLAACGGGGGGSRPQPFTPPPPAPTPTPTPTPAPTPTPTPAPTPTPTSFETAEYNRSTGVVQANAITAYRNGATGAGILAGVIDSGIDVDNAEFAGRISAASADLDGNRGLQDLDGHGTAVSSVLLGAKNDSGTHGVAFDATLLVLRTDEPGSCIGTGGSVEDSGCQHNDVAIARAVDLAVTQNARVVNISLGGSAPSNTLRNAFARATAAGVVIVISAGNDGAANPDPFAQVASEALAQGQIVIAGSVNASGAISSFSNRAGVNAQDYLVALGSQVRTIDQTGTAYFYSGTSFSAPHIAGAVALLAQAFPNLTGAQIVQLLYASATDLGTPGPDAVYGRGLLNIGAAFQPQGQTSLAGSATPVSLTGGSTLSAPMGDGGQGSLGAVILDGFDRAFAADLAASVRRASPATTLTASLLGDQRSLAASGGDTTIALSIRPGAEGVAIDRLLLTGREADQARATAAFVSSRLGRDTRVALGISQSGAGLAAHLAERAAPPFLVARDFTQTTGFDRLAGSAFAVRQPVGRLNLWASAEQGRALVNEPARTGRYQRYRYDMVAVGADRRFGPVSVAASASHLIERQTVLGARFAPALGIGGGRSWFVDVETRADIAPNWTIGGSARWGWTVAGARLRTDAYAVDLSGHGLFEAGDRLAFRLAQPLRVRSGGLSVELPVGYDYAIGVTDYARQRLDLSPEGREIDVEASYVRALWGGRIGANLFYRREPGHIAAFPDDVGAAIRFSRGF